MEITKEIIEHFKSWLKLKIRIHLSEPKVYPKPREIWWASIGQNIGAEVNGKNDNFERPVLVLRVFYNEFILVVPISSIKKEGRYYASFKNADNKDNILVLSQLKSISSKRLLRKVGEISTEDFLNVRNKIKKFI